MEKHYEITTFQNWNSNSGNFHGL